MNDRPQAYSFEGVTPVIDASAYVHPSVTLIGDVIVGPGCYVAAGVVLRGDFGRIVLELESNVQDNCVIHSRPDFDCVMEHRAHVGHAAVLHGCRIGRDALVGMNAVVMDRALIGERSIVAAMSFVKIGAQVPPRVLLTGVPARVVRELTDADLADKAQGTDLYIELAKRCLAGLRRCEPLAAVQTDRARTRWTR